MRKPMIFAVVLAMAPCFGQITGGHENVQDAIRFERQKDAAAARQARMERRQSQSSTAERSTERPRAKSRKAKSGSATRTEMQK